MRRVVGQSSNPHNVLRTRIQMDRELYHEDELLSEVDVDPFGDDPTSELDELTDEFGRDNVEAAYYFFHRHRLWKMHILRREDLDEYDLVVFMLIEEEQSLKQAESAAKLEDKARG